MRFVIKHGTPIETLTPEEAQRMLDNIRDRDARSRVRAPAIVQLDGNGNGQVEVYEVPVGFEFEGRRMWLDLDTASDPATGSVTLDQSSSTQSEINVANPAPGAEWNYQVPVGASQRILLVHERLTTSAVVANRVPAINITDATAVRLFRISAPSAIGAGLQQEVAFPASQAVGTFNSQQGTVGAQVVSIPTLWLPTGYVVSSSTLGMDVGDQWDQVKLIVETRNSTVRSVEYLRSGTRMEYASTSSPVGGDPQVPGIQTWGAEQGPYLRNGEVFEVRARGLTPNARLSATLEGILSRPYAPRQQR